MMSFTDCINQSPLILMEGALGERLKREYGLVTKGTVDMAGLVRTPEGRKGLQTIWNEYIDVARRHKLPFIATTPTRRVNRERVTAAGLDDGIIADNVRFLASLRDASGIQMYAGGMMGCKGNAYTAEGCLPSAQAAADFHRWEAGLFREAGADFLFAGLIPTLPEGMGIAQAMGETGLPYIISLTIQADGRLIDGTTIADAIAAIDAYTAQKPICYITNCVHPHIVTEALAHPFNQTQAVRLRFRGLQANTSALSYKELDNSPDLRTSDPDTLAAGMLKLRNENGFQIFGGCCGTDARHLESMATLLTSPCEG